ncbi:hypothetical protein [Paucisalibacillus globulus]|jgi:hypothetical protein|uniref:hypothetical protein n=1 Tax=Paucisalibacillus globulus TaxID=351095 RepID=UPI000BB7DF24|nr:hypothetical protein [Paucisalibacillus globulus]
MKHKHMYDLCKTHMHSYVLAELEDGTNFDGIITGLDEEYVYFAVPIENEVNSQMMPNMNEQRQFGWYGYGYPGFGYPGYGYFGPRRRFRRLVLPLAALAALSVLPWY